jgi:hypothetical protein
MYYMILVFLHPGLNTGHAPSWCACALIWCLSGKALSVADNQAVEKKYQNPYRSFLFQCKNRVEYAPFSFYLRSPGGHSGHLVPHRG